jgi:hypothetical protein
MYTQDVQYVWKRIWLGMSCVQESDCRFANYMEANIAQWEYHVIMQANIALQIVENLADIVGHVMSSRKRMSLCKPHGSE